MRGGRVHAFLQLDLHHSAGLELDGPLGRHLDAFERLWILCDSRGAAFNFKHAEVAKFQPVAVSKLVDDLAQEALYDFLHDNAFALGQVGNSINKFLFRYRVHELFLCS